MITQKNLKVCLRHSFTILIFLINIRGKICNNSEDSEILYDVFPSFDFFIGKDYSLTNDEAYISC